MKTLKGSNHTIKTVKTLKQIKPNHSEIKRIRCVVDSSIGDCDAAKEETVEPKEEINYKNEAGKYRLICISRYLTIYQARFNERPFPVFIEKQIERGKSDKYGKIFKGIVEFLYSEREQNNACNKMFNLITDYFNCVFDYYQRFNRRPTINQISAGPTNVSSFVEFINYENGYRGGYWIDKNKESEANELIERGGQVYKDEFLNSVRVKVGLTPFFENGN